MVESVIRFASFCACLVVVALGKLQKASEIFLHKVQKPGLRSVCSR